MKVTIAPGCIACSACEQICPAVFTVSEESIVDPAGIPGHERACRDAAKVCPVDVILIEE
jgi:ferredoxin